VLDAKKYSDRSDMPSPDGNHTTKPKPGLFITENRFAPKNTKKLTSRRNFAKVSKVGKNTKHWNCSKPAVPAEKKGKSQSAASL